MCKKILSSLFIIFISQSILFSQDNCEDLTQDECTESLFCSWSIVVMPNGIFEICIESNDDGGWEDNDMCSEFPPDMCETLPFCELTAAGCVMADMGDDGGDWSDDSTGWNDDGGWEDNDMCSEFPPDMCETLPFCELTAAGCVMADMGDDDEDEDWLCSDIDNPFECYAMDCEWIQSNNTPIGGSCTEGNDDWDEEDECRLFESEDECVAAGCAWDSEDGCYDHMDEDNDGPPECLLDCEGIENVNPEQNPYEFCDWVISNFGPNNFFNQCAEDCDDFTMMEINEFVEVCYECLADNNCDDVFNDEDNEDWEDECRQFESEDECLEVGCLWGDDGCYGYDDEESGVLFGFVEYIWGDAIEMVANAHIQVELIYSNSIIFETYTNDSGAYEILLPRGSYTVTVSAYEDSQSTGISIESNQQYELNFQLGEWGWPEPQTILSLGDGIGTQEGFTVPLYLQTETPVSGLQFAVLPEYAGGGFWFTPSELESTNDCFAASFNDVYSQLWGIIFSLEGCTYEPGEHHVANLSFTVAEGSTVPPGTNVHLVFNYTLVSDPDANEIASSGEGSMVTFGQLGDVNSDGAINVVDIVNMVNFALQIDEPSEYESWSADLNEDGDINVLDIVSVVNIILYGDDLQRADSGDAEIYYNKKEVHIEGKNVAGFQISFSDDINLNQIQIPDGWISKSHNHSLIAYTLNGNLLNGHSIIKLNQSTQIVELIVVDANGKSIMASINMLPNTISLGGNFPNPFNPETSITYTLSHDAQVILSVYDLSGRLVEVLVDGQQYPGEFLVSWSAHNLPSGIYIARLMVGDESFTQKMMLMK